MKKKKEEMIGMAAVYQPQPNRAQRRSLARGKAEVNPMQLQGKRRGGVKRVGHVKR